jgi:hypothetical protein
MTQAECARRVQVNVRSLRRWLTDNPEFAAMVAAEKLAGRDIQADDVLRDLLLSTDERVRLAAARELRSRTPVTIPAEGKEDADVFDGWEAT